MGVDVASPMERESDKWIGSRVAVPHITYPTPSHHPHHVEQGASPSPQLGPWHRGEEPQAPVGTKGIKKAVRKTRGKGRRSDASFVYIADVFLFCNLKGLP